MTTTITVHVVSGSFGSGAPSVEVFASDAAALAYIEDQVRELCEANSEDTDTELTTMRATVRRWTGYELPSVDGGRFLRLSSHTVAA
jgi:hypothetical protein